MQSIVYFIRSKYLQVCYKVSFCAHGNKDKQRFALDVLCTPPQHAR